jgi:hypothetical protein
MNNIQASVITFLALCCLLSQRGLIQAYRSLGIILFNTTLLLSKDNDICLERIKSKAKAIDYISMFIYIKLNHGMLS